LLVDVKAIHVAPIRSDVANAFVKKHHYSGKVVNNSQLHFGAFYEDILHGVMSFGPSLDKRKIQGLVSGTLWNEFLELNRMAFDDFLPKNSESRSIAVAMRLIRYNYPQIKWVVSFADGAQCGDGAIYRASGFVLTGIRKNTSLWAGPDGGVIADANVKPNPLRVFSRTSLTDGKSKQQQQQAKAIISRTTAIKGTHTAATNGGASMRAYKEAGFAPIPGFQLRYIYFLDKSSQPRLTVPILPFSKIDEMGAGMYKGKNIKIADRKPCAGSETVTRPPIQAGEGGSIPTPALSGDTNA
jgi:hypothetical protein